MGYLLNADLTVLANFTNPNKKVSVDFSYLYLDLYFENTLIATQYIEPFSATRGQSIFANIHMVSSQVKLSMKESMLLQKQIQNNRVIFTVKGMFRARSNLGSFLKYSYWLHEEIFTDWVGPIFFLTASYPHLFFSPDQYIEERRPYLTKSVEGERIREKSESLALAMIFGEEGVPED
ncbi:hypothetical protein Gotri_000036 [Gossypium trilobum]|uniref:Late embryogenesis abundant protein LEA-2 subgroup domain-containing protein n=1 Tax=Gossypium trilobum TaxID=34281 RepID=A0A7J9FHH7_9ROSI|nr:hypothetical protein [Gossypium trilobum]